MSRRVRILLYALYGELCLSAALLLTFPYDTLARRLEYEAGRRPGTSLSIGEIGPALPFGLRLGDVTFSKASRDGGPARKLQLEEVRLTPALMPLLRGKAGVDAGLSLMGGHIDATVAVGRDSRQLNAELQELSLAEGGLIQSFTGLNLSGVLNGSLELATDGAGHPNGGRLSLEIADAALKGGKALNVTLPAMALGQPKIEAEIAGGTARLSKLEARSEEVELSGSATVTLKPELMLSPLKGSLRFKPAPALVARTPALQVMAAMAGPNRKPDAPVDIPLAGTLGSPRVVGAPKL